MTESLFTPIIFIKNDCYKHLMIKRFKKKIKILEFELPQEDNTIFWAKEISNVELLKTERNISLIIVLLSNQKKSFRCLTPMIWIKKQ